jgi:N-formylglutamate amidohydrolase
MGYPLSVLRRVYTTRVLIFCTKSANSWQKSAKTGSVLHMTQNDDEAYKVYGRDALAIPVLVSVPHAGRYYPAPLFDALRLPKTSLTRLEDRYADLLIRDLVKSGFPVIVASYARAWIDLNREESELDIEMVYGLDKAAYPAPGAKQRGGLGLIPRRLSGEGDLWKHRFDKNDIAQRIAHCHCPYHFEINALLTRMREKFGVAILLDLHSMPPIHIPQIRSPQFVVGDRFGQSAASTYTDLLLSRLRAGDYPSALNHPYSGEYILRRHGRPTANVHALQVEVDRSLYLDSALREPGAGLARTTSVIGLLVEALVDQALGTPTLLAAE